MSAAKAVEEVARVDGSAGWCVMIAGQCGAFSAFLPDAEVRRIWGNGGIVAGTARPIGRAVATNTPEPGFIVSGKWQRQRQQPRDLVAAECLVYDGDELDGMPTATR